MSIELDVRDAVAEWQPAPTEPDWDDVLRRARPNEPRPGRRGRPTLLVAAAALALVLALPALGVGERLASLISGGKHGGDVGTALTRADGTNVGTFTIFSGRFFVIVAGRRTPAPSTRRGFPIGWMLGLGVPARSARLVARGAGRTISVLCKPCRQGTSNGELTLSRRDFSLLFGRADVVLSTAEGEARGRVHVKLIVLRR